MKKDEFWSKHYKKFDFDQPSNFCNFFVNNYLNQNDHVIELGCGNGRDGIQIHKNSAFYTGVDLCENAIKKCNQKFAQINKHENYEFIKSSMTLIDIEKKAKNLVFYSRFSLHSISFEDQKKLIKKLESLDEKWIFAIEVRTIFDELYGVGKPLKKNEFYTDHYRRFIDPDEFISEIKSKFFVKYEILSKGLAKYKDEDPKVLRLIFSNHE